MIGGLYLCQCLNEVVQRQKFHTKWRLVNHRALRLKRKPLLVLVDYQKQHRLKQKKKVVITTIAVHVGKVEMGKQDPKNIGWGVLSHWLTCFL